MVAFFETLFDLLHLLDCRKLPLPMLSLPIHSISQLSNLEPAAEPPVAEKHSRNCQKSYRTSNPSEQEPRGEEVKKIGKNKTKVMKPEGQGKEGSKDTSTKNIPTKPGEAFSISQSSQGKAKIRRMPRRLQRQILNAAILGKVYFLASMRLLHFLFCSTLVCITKSKINSCSYLAKAYHATS